MPQLHRLATASVCNTMLGSWQPHRSSRRSLQERDALKDKYMRFSAGASLHIVTLLSLRSFAVAYDRVRSQLMAATALRPGWSVRSML